MSQTHETQPSADHVEVLPYRGTVEELPALWRKRAARKRTCGLRAEAELDDAHANELDAAIAAMGAGVLLAAPPAQGAVAPDDGSSTAHLHASGPVDGMGEPHKHGDYIAISIAHTDGIVERVRLSEGAAELLMLELEGILRDAPLYAGTAPAASADPHASVDAPAGCHCAAPQVCNCYLSAPPRAASDGVEDANFPALLLSLKEVEKAGVTFNVPGCHDTKFTYAEFTRAWLPTLAALNAAHETGAQGYIDPAGNVITPMPTTHCSGGEVKDIGGFMRCTVCNGSFGPSTGVQGGG